MSTQKINLLTCQQQRCYQDSHLNLPSTKLAKEIELEYWSKMTKLQSDTRNMQSLPLRPR